MSIKAVGWALDQNPAGLDAVAKLVLIGIAEAADRTDDCAFLGRESLADIAMVASIRTIARITGTLVELGLIEKVDEDALCDEHAERYCRIRGDRRPKIYRINRTERGANIAPRDNPRGAARGAARGAKRGAAAAAPEPSNNHEPKENDPTSSSANEPEPDLPTEPTSTAVADEITEFETWWEHVPRRVGKGQARNAYRTARKKLAAAELLAAADRWTATVAGADLQFVPHPSTWLNGERWTDDEPPAPQPDSEPAAGPGPRQPPIYEPDTAPADQAASADAVRRIRQEAAA